MRDTFYPKTFTYATSKHANDRANSHAHMHVSQMTFYQYPCHMYSRSSIMKKLLVQGVSEYLIPFDMHVD